VLVRGTASRLNSMLINGERIPSPEADGRDVFEEHGSGRGSWCSCWP
jgi:hypothetical protein